jgi:lipopolysaccharide/colanic/teichoic acid biosynthesis glycosyltransferase
MFLSPPPFWKRLMDVLGAGVLLILLSPLMIGAAIMVRLSSPGPIIFRQKRAGLGGKPFWFYKFRTMYIDAEQRKQELMHLNEAQGPVFKIANDPRVTPIGRNLRRMSIDELPQLWNVLKGDMSLVGPRPPTMDEIDKYTPWQRRRLEVQGGLTCIWQVSGRCLIPFEEWMRMDLRYSRKISPINDLSLLFKTVGAVLSRRGAK